MAKAAIKRRYNFNVCRENRGHLFISDGLFLWEKRMAIKTQGTQLFIIDEQASDGPEVLSIECATSLSGLGAAREQIEVTCLESDAREYVGGLATPGQLTVTVNFDPANNSHFRLYEMWKDNVNFKASIGFGPETNTPDIDSSGDFDFPTARTYIAFEGYIADLPLDIALNAVVTAAIPIQVSGDYTIFRKST